MSEELPSLLRFQPKFFLGGPEHFHLPLVYDLVATKKPKAIVALGFGDGEIYFTTCQAVRENRLACRLIALRVPETGQLRDDNAWLTGREYNREFYGDFSAFHDGTPEEAAASVANGNVDLFLLNDCDSFAVAMRLWDLWLPKISETGVILVHGIGTRREQGVAQFWAQIRTKSSVEFSAGAGIGVTSAEFPATPEVARIIGGPGQGAATEQAYQLMAARIASQAEAGKVSRENRMLQLRQIWLPTLLEDRIEMQNMIDHLNRHIAHIEQVHTSNETELRHQLATLEKALAEREATIGKLRDDHSKLKARIAEVKRQVNQTSTKRSVPEKIAREIQRIPKNLRRLLKTEPVKKKGDKPATKGPTLTEQAAATAPSAPLERYELWIREREPDKAALAGQRRYWNDKQRGPKISLLVPVHDTAAGFLREMFDSVRQQTYPNWELCLVDAGSTRPETIAVLKTWSDPRIRFERLDRNLGISANTNRALALATGEFIALLDHDDLLATFALHELARSIEEFPGADIFYSDEDRLGQDRRRHSPFFKPEWSPELLYSCMYVGHLTAYRRTLVEKVGKFREEFDLSQDYDLALRATEQAREIRHIPHILYHWREHPTSGSLGGKPEARKTNLAALGDAMLRRNLPAEIIEYSTANRARLRVCAWPRVSIVVPTDSLERATTVATRLARMSSYPDLEIIIVTNSRIANALTLNRDRSASVRVVRYDKPFNFSDKCNVGAAMATGGRLVFLNDDIEPQQRDWVENLIEPLENPEVGAVAPKLLYQTGTIQHAGLITGVPGVVGTAFHQVPGDSTVHVNFVQSMRNVSAVSGACMAMRRKDFEQLGGFDAINLPILHSDVDLCFKVREAGMRCVYTPFVVLTHGGHTSLGALAVTKQILPDSADLYLRKRWSDFTAYDPYFPTNMRDWLYTDSSNGHWTA